MALQAVLLLSDSRRFVTVDCRNAPIKERFVGSYDSWQLLSSPCNLPIGIQTLPLACIYCRMEEFVSRHLAGQWISCPFLWPSYPFIWPHTRVSTTCYLASTIFHMAGIAFRLVSNPVCPQPVMWPSRLSVCLQSMVLQPM